MSKNLNLSCIFDLNMIKSCPGSKLKNIYTKKQRTNIDMSYISLKGAVTDMRYFARNKFFRS